MRRYHRSSSAAREQSSTSVRLSELLLSFSTACTAARKPSFWRSANRCGRNSTARVLGFRPSCLERQKAGTPVEHLPQEIVMPVEDIVDAALAGLDQSEFVNIPALPDAGQWQTYEAARQALRPNVSRVEPAARHGIVRVRA